MPKEVIQGISFVYKDKNAQAVVRHMIDAEDAGKKLQRRIEGLKKKADFKQLTDSSEEYQKQLLRLSDASKKAGAESQSMGKMMLVNSAAALQLARGLGQAAAAAGAFALSGAVAADQTAAFNAAALGTLPTLKQLQEATGKVVDETSLQEFAIMASSVGISSKEMLGLAQTMTIAAEKHGRLNELSRLLGDALQGRTAKIRKLGIAIDISSGAFAGLTEEQKKHKIAVELSTMANQDQVDSLDSMQQRLLQTKASMDDAESSLSEAWAKMLEATKITDAFELSLEGLAWTTTAAVTGFRVMGEALGILDEKKNTSINTAKKYIDMTYRERIANDGLLLSQLESGKFWDVDKTRTESRIQAAKDRLLVSKQMLDIEKARGEEAERVRKFDEGNVIFDEFDVGTITATEKPKSTRKADAEEERTAWEEEMMRGAELAIASEEWAAMQLARSQTRADASRMVADREAEEIAAVAEARDAETARATEALNAWTSAQLDSLGKIQAARKADVALQKQIAAQNMAIAQAAIGSAARLAGGLIGSKATEYGFLAGGEAAAAFAAYPDPVGMFNHGTAAVLYAAQAAKGGGGGGGGTPATPGGGGGPTAQSTVLSGTNETAIAQEESRSRVAPIFYFPNAVIDERAAGEIVTRYGNAYANDGGQGTMDSRLIGGAQQGQPGF